MKTMGPVAVVSDVCPSGGRLSFVDITCVYSYTKLNSSHFASTVYLFLWLTKNNCLNFAVFVNERQMTMYGISVAGITRVFSWHAVLTSHKRIEKSHRKICNPMPVRREFKNTLSPYTWSYRFLYVSV